MDPYATALHNLETLKDAYSNPADRNEATTRIQLIDRLLLDCLGWTPEDLTLEEHYDGEYVDYAIGKRAKALIVEAKREGIHFTVPAGVAGRRHVEITTLLTALDTRKAINQVIGYCQKRGVPIAVLANGHQIIAFFASRQDSVPPLEGRALLFSSLQEMCDDFSTLWSLLSKEGIATRNLQRALLGRRPIALSPEKLSDRIQGYPGFRPRTQLETDLKIIGGLFIQDLEDEEEVEDQFLEKCYCSSGALSQYALVSKEILRARYASVKKEHPGQVESAYTKKGVNPALTTHAMSKALSRRPIIILGDVGVGKTIFLKHLIRIDAKDILQGSLVLYVDFGREPALASNLEEFVAKRLTDQLRDTYDINIRERRFVRAAYNREINQFKQEVAGYLEDEDPAEFRRRELAMLEKHINDGPAHLRRSLEHIRGTSQRSPLVILDNIDQRPKEFQERVFLIGQSLAETWPGTVFISLRPTTFFESRSSGSLAAYQPRMFTIAPARTDQVILKRLLFARTKIDEASVENVFPHGLSIDSSDLSAYMDVLIRAFETNDELKELIDNLSGGNLRTALMFLYAFVGSGYVSTKRVLEVADRGGLYSVPMHEFLRAIIFGDHEHFQPNASAICNLFDVSENDGREHFLLASVLAHVQRLGESAGRDGFVPLDEIYDFTQGLGFSQEQTGKQLERALAKRLLESSSGESNSAPCRVTTNGSYTYRNLIQRFVYVDAMIVDTPIIDAGFRRQIQNVTTIFDRLDRACIFREYLDNEWKRFEAGANDLSFRWDVASEALRRDINDARYRAERARSKREGNE